MILKFRTIDGISYRFAERLSKIYYDKSRKAIVFGFDDGTKERIYLVNEDGEKFCEFIARMIDSANGNLPPTVIDIGEVLRSFRKRDDKSKEED